MNGGEFLRKLRRLGRRRGIEVELVEFRGKGSWESTEGSGRLSGALRRSGGHRADEDGKFIVSFRDVPEALSSGEPLEEALSEAADCLVLALDGYVDDRRSRPIPRPSRSGPGERAVAVPPLIAAKLALHDAIRDAGLTPTTLAERLDLSEPGARRLLDLGHRSRIEEVQAALANLGERIEFGQ
jgi:antitoxin HicB